MDAQGNSATNCGIIKNSLVRYKNGMAGSVARLCETTPMQVTSKTPGMSNAARGTKNRFKKAPARLIRLKLKMKTGSVARVTVKDIRALPINIFFSRDFIDPDSSE